MTSAALGPYDRRAPAPDYVDLARDEIAREIEAEFPGTTVTHDLYGWSAARPGREPVRGQTPVALRALLPYSSD